MSSTFFRFKVRHYLNKFSFVKKTLFFKKGGIFVFLGIVIFAFLITSSVDKATQSNGLFFRTTASLTGCAPEDLECNQAAIGAYNNQAAQQRNDYILQQQGIQNPQSQNGAFPGQTNPNMPSNCGPGSTNTVCCVTPNNCVAIQPGTSSQTPATGQTGTGGACAAGETQVGNTTCCTSPSSCRGIQPVNGVYPTLGANYVQKIWDSTQNVYVTPNPQGESVAMQQQRLAQEAAKAAAEEAARQAAANQVAPTAVVAKPPAQTPQQKAAQDLLSIQKEADKDMSGQNQARDDEAYNKDLENAKNERDELISRVESYKQAATGGANKALVLLQYPQIAKIENETIPALDRKINVLCSATGNASDTCKTINRTSSDSDPIEVIPSVTSCNPIKNYGNVSDLSISLAPGTCDPSILTTTSNDYVIFGPNFNTTFSIPGIGTGTTTGQNNELVKKIINSEFQLQNSNKEPVRTVTMNVTYNPETGRFEDSVLLGRNLPSGQYALKLRTNNSLWKNVGNITINSDGTTSSLPNVDLISGDSNQDNTLNLIDYNALVSCLSSGRCTEGDKNDLNLDGKVDELDLNIFLSGLRNRNGD